MTKERLLNTAEERNWIVSIALSFVAVRRALMREGQIKNVHISSSSLFQNWERESE